ncbi:hypothetical protein ACQUQU_13255 [Thalassolituus sp. LLYu03]|uniref:hypothetical protein n=1 Tax=Thalassolituus sp. LLYu03 TaxID=3421656 RepID=UPI003D2782C1
MNTRIFLGLAAVLCAVLLAAGEYCADFVPLPDVSLTGLKVLLLFAGAAALGAVLCGFIFWFCFFISRDYGFDQLLHGCTPFRSFFYQKAFVSAHGCRAPPL